MTNRIKFPLKIINLPKSSLFANLLQNLKEPHRLIAHIKQIESKN